MTHNYKDQLGHFLRNPGGFSVLILGDRGTGKTRFANEYSETPIVFGNCASFADETIAESILFGHAKGSFTGAFKSTNGLFGDAEGKMLFLDEVHTLKNGVQQKLMTALQTSGSGNNKGKFAITRLGETRPRYVSLRPVFASNNTTEQLRQKLMPDFYDRISQLVIEIPSIANSDISLKVAFQRVWEEMQFQNENNVPKLPDMYKWLNSLRLEGNYRTLQNIAINWHQGRLMNLENEHSVFEFVKDQMTKYHLSPTTPNIHPKFNFRKGETKDTLIREYRTALFHWAKQAYGGNKAAQEALKFQRLDSLLR